MEIFALIVVLGISMALIFGLPFGIAEYSYHFLKKKKVPIFLRWLAIIPALVALYFLAAAILPDQHRYDLDYWEIVGYPMTDNTTIFYGQADQHGKHAGDFSLGMQTYLDDFKGKWDLLQRRGFAEDSTSKIPDTIQCYIKENHLNIIHKFSLTRYTHYNYYVEMLSDSSTIFMRKEPK